MHRRSFVRGVALGGSGLVAGCSAINGGSGTANATSITDVGVERAGNLIGYSDLRCSIPKEESLPTPVSAIQFGDGDGEHWVYLILDSQETTAVDVAVAVDARTFFEETVELGGDRFVSYEFTVEEPYTVSYSVGGNGGELDVAEELVHTPDRQDRRVSGQTVCISPDGSAGEQVW